MIDRTFIIDSEHLDDVTSRLYGYMVTDDGTLHLDTIPPQPSEAGVFVLVTRGQDTIAVRQDFMGSFGLYLYRQGDRFMLSNSFFALCDQLPGKLTLNETYARALLFACEIPLACGDTLANEITVLDPWSRVEIDLPTRTLSITGKDFGAKGRALDSREAFDELDAWYYKWVGVFRMLVKEGHPIQEDLSGGMDTRLILSMMLNGNIDLNHSVNLLTHEKAKIRKDAADKRIAREIAHAFDLNLNGESVFGIDKQRIDALEELYASQRAHPFGNNVMARYSHTEFDPPLVMIKGLGSLTQGGHISTPEGALGHYAKQVHRVKHGKPGEDSCSKPTMLARAILDSLTESKLLAYYRQAEARILEGHHSDKIHEGQAIFRRATIENLDGKKVTYLMSFNKLVVSPFFDPAIAQFDFDPESRDNLFLSTLLLQRYGGKLMDFEIQGRTLSKNSIVRATKLNAAFPLEPRHYDRLSNAPTMVSQKHTKKADILASLEAKWQSDEFQHVVAGAFGGKLTKRVIANTDRNKIDSGIQPINALLAVYEFLKLNPRRDQR